MYELLLVEPSKDLESTAMQYRNDYIEHGETHINGSCGFIRYSNYDEWLQKIDNKIVGSIQLRHELNDDLRKRGGHIGYGICPSEWKKGYGTKQLSFVLEKAKELLIPRVMISCDKNNLGSAKVAINNGGKLEWEGHDEVDGYIQIYWITIK
jgi:predicted acetyltransferase